MANAPKLKFYKDENLPPDQIEKLHEIMNLFHEDGPKWISRTECLNVKSPDSSCIFVFAKFEGSAFEHLRMLKTRIISAHCMLMSVKFTRKLPRLCIPIYSLAMTNLNICCTNIEKKLRAEIYDKVEMMMGKTSRIFTESITHLITTEVGSAKYYAAAQMKIPVMLPDFVLEVWKACESAENIDANDEIFQKYKCPIFNKYVICATGFSESTKNEIKSLVEKEGGTYSGDLALGNTTHLISREAKGSKYDHAKLWKITVVKPEWIYESIKAKYCLHEQDFRIDVSNQTSTPTDNRVLKNRAAPDIDISVINGNLIKSTPNVTKCVNETDVNYRTMSNTMLSSTYNSTLANANNINNASNRNTTPKPLSNYTDILKELNTIGKIDLALFDGIGIYFENFDSAIMEKLKKICNSGGSTRFDEYNSDVTHVIVNQVNEAKCKSYNELNPEVNIVNIDWLIKSCKQNELEDCKDYVVFKNSLNSVKTPKKRSRPEKSNSNASTSNNLGDSDLNGYLSQYLNMEAAITKPKNPMPPPTNLFAGFQVTPNTTKNSTVQASNEIEDRTSKKITPSTINDASTSIKPINKDTRDRLFLNKKFQIFGFTDAEIEEQEKALTEMGAVIVKFDANVSFSSYRNTDIDYTILPMTLPAPTSNNNPATVYWMRKCIEKNKIFELTDDVFYQPIPKHNDEKPLSSCVITISGFTGAEKDNISNLCKLLGGHVQQQLCLKNTNDLLGNTHLICHKANGPKYIAAKSWNLPAVGYEWIIDSCVTGSKADETKYSIEKEIDTKELIEALGRIRTNNDTLQSSFANASITNRSITTSNENKRLSKNNKDTSNLSGLNDSSLSYPKDIKRQRLDKDDDKDNSNAKTKSINDDQDDEEFEEKNEENEKMKGIDGRENEDLNDVEDVAKENDQEDEDDEEAVLAAIENFSKSGKANISMPQKERATETPQILTPCNPRLKELRQTGISLLGSSPKGNENENKNQTANSNNDINNTPIWMKKNQDPLSYKPNLGWGTEMANFTTPQAVKDRHPNLTLPPKPETPLEILFAEGIRNAHKNSQLPGFFEKPYSPGFSNDYSFEKTPNTEKRNRLGRVLENTSLEPKLSTELTNSQVAKNDLEQSKKILKDVKIYLCKKLIKQQSDVYAICEELGAELLWAYDKTVTHFIYSGKLTDTYKELRVAIEDEKIIVTLGWLMACKEQGKKVDERSHSLASNSTKLSLKSPAVNRVSNRQIPSLEFVESRNMEKIAIKNEKIETHTFLIPDSEPNPETEPELKPENEQAVENAKDYNETIQHNDDVPEPNVIPDSMDLKVMLLDQLTDKLASIKNNPVVVPKKFSKNNSNLNNSEFNGESDLTSETHKEVHQNQDETVLNEQQALNELNNSRSKWGINTAGSNDSIERIRTRTKSFTDKNEKNKNNENQNDDTDILLSFLDKQQGVENGKKLSNNDLNIIDSKMLKPSSGLEDLGSPSLLNTKKKFNYNEPPASSQIQMTIWKEDQSSSSSTASSISSNNRKKSTNKSTDKDAIAERFINVSRGNSSRK